MIKRTLSLLPNLLIFSLMFSVMGCYLGKAAFTVKNGRIPPDFSTYKDTLLVGVRGEDFNHGYDKFLKSTFEANYHGPYKLVTKADLYFYPADRYRYIFSYTMEVGLALGPSGPNGMNQTYTYNFGVVDRTNEKNRYIVRTSSSVHLAMKYYVVALDNERQSH
jgi:hypothetical protein